MLAGELARIKRERGGNVYEARFAAPPGDLAGIAGVASVERATTPTGSTSRPTPTRPRCWRRSSRAARASSRSDRSSPISSRSSSRRCAMRPDHIVTILKREYLTRVKSQGILDRDADPAAGDGGARRPALADRDEVAREAAHGGGRRDWAGVAARLAGAAGEPRAAAAPRPSPRPAARRDGELHGRGARAGRRPGRAARRRSIAASSPGRSTPGSGSPRPGSSAARSSTTPRACRTSSPRGGSSARSPQLVAEARLTPRRARRGRDRRAHPRRRSRHRAGIAGGRAAQEAGHGRLLPRLLPLLPALHGGRDLRPAGDERRARGEEQRGSSRCSSRPCGRSS